MSRRVLKDLRKRLGNFGSTRAPEISTSPTSEKDSTLVLSHFLALPDDVILAILYSGLTPKELIALSHVCTSLSPG